MIIDGNRVRKAGDGGLGLTDPAHVPGTVAGISVSVHRTTIGSEGVKPLIR
jgi:hypothetical protein